MAINNKAFWDVDTQTTVSYDDGTSHLPSGPTITSDSLNDITLFAKDIKMELSDGTRVSIKEILDRLKNLEEIIGIENVLLGDKDTK